MKTVVIATTTIKNTDFNGDSHEIEFIVIIEPKTGIRKEYKVMSSQRTENGNYVHQPYTTTRFDHARMVYGAMVMADCIPMRPKS